MRWIRASSTRFGHFPSCSMMVMNCAMRSSRQSDNQANILGDRPSMPAPVFTLTVAAADLSSCTVGVGNMSICPTCLHGVLATAAFRCQRPVPRFHVFVHDVLRCSGQHVLHYLQLVGLFILTLCKCMQPSSSAAELLLDPRPLTLYHFKRVCLFLFDQKSSGPRRRCL